MTQYLQTIFYHYTLTNPVLTSKIEAVFFDAKTVQICYKYAKAYVIKYHDAPSATQLKEILNVEGKSDIVTDDIVDVLYSAQDVLSQYSDEWLYDNVTAWAEWCALVHSVRNMVEYIKLQEPDVSPENIKHITEVAKSTFNKTCILDFQENDKAGTDFWDAISHKQIKMKRSPTGYPYLDTCLKGGYFPGCLVCFVGGPKKGKSLWMQNLCAASVKMGENNLYISLELEEEMIHNRIGSNLFGIPSISYERQAEDVDKMRDIMMNFRKTSIPAPGALIVKTFPTSTLSVLDLEAFILKTEEQLSYEGNPFKFKNVFVDYINIMRNWRNENSENTYMKIKQIAEDLKAMGKKGNWAIITATQTNRTGVQDDSDISSSQVAESMGINATVDLLMGIIQSAPMKANGIYQLKCLLDRVINKADTKKEYTVDWNFMRIVETAGPEIDCSFEVVKNTPTTYNQQKFNNMSNVTSQPITAPVMSNNITNNTVSITGAGLFDIKPV